MSEGNASRNHKATDYERAAGDWYVEPRWCVEQLASALTLAPDSYVWDPCCGGGMIPTVFGERRGRHLVRATDIADRGFERFDEQWDATAWGTPHCITPNMRLNIITNPPFKIAERVIRRALDLADHKVAVLQQLQFLASKQRHALFTEFPPAEVLILSRRPSMPPGDKIAELGDRAFSGGTTDFCWIIWDKPHDRETRVRWLHPESGAAAA